MDSFHQQTGLKFREKLVKCCILKAAYYVAETWELRKVEQKYLERFEMWCLRRMEKTTWTDSVKEMEKCYIQSRRKGKLYVK
jgi:hypothetical protein